MLSDIDQKVSTLVEELFPSNYRENAPQLVEFVKSYYEWAEQVDNFEYASKFLRALRDIEESPEKYLAYHQGEMQPTIPSKTVADTRLLIKNVLDFYRSRGSEQSYKTLFRIVYGYDIEIYYPYNDVLIASGSKWYQEKNIRVIASVGNPENLTDQVITGFNSGATCYVVTVESEIISGVQYYKLVISDVVGSFVHNETLFNEDQSIKVITQGAVDFVAMSNSDVPTSGISGGGVGHQVNDVLSIISNAAGLNARAKVMEVDDETSVDIAVNYGGKGYTVGNTTIQVSGVGSNATAVVTSISNTEIITFNNQQLIGALSIPLNYINWGNTAAFPSTPFASGIERTDTIASSLTYSTVTVGKIATIRMTNYGAGYFILPSTLNVVATDNYIYNHYYTTDPDRPSARYGNSATFSVTYKPGYIKTVDVTNRGTGYQSFETIRLVNLTRGGTTNATGVFTANVNPLNTLQGFYLGNQGHLSDDKYLQDNDYYNKHSYEIKAPLDISTYKDYVKKLLHPAGTKMFGRVQFTDIINVPVTVVSSIEQVLNGTGNIMIPGNNQIGYYAANSFYTIDALDNISMADWGSNAMVIGKDLQIPEGPDTKFESESSQGSYIKIIPTDSPTSNATIKIKTISSNGVLVITQNYPFGRVANAGYGFSESL